MNKCSSCKKDITKSIKYKAVNGEILCVSCSAKFLQKEIIEVDNTKEL